jgi:hypothetical protein
MLTDQHWRHVGEYRVPCSVTVTVCNERQSAKQASRTARRPGSFVMVGATITKECDGWRNDDIRGGNGTAGTLG